MSPISTGTHRFGTSIRLPGTDPFATAMAASPDGKAVYVAFGVNTAGGLSAVVIDRISTTTGRLTSVALAAQT